MKYTGFWSRWGGAVFGPAIFLLGSAVAAYCGEGASVPAAAEGANRISYSGTVGLFGKYNSNLGLGNSRTNSEPILKSFITEPTAKLRAAKSWGSAWWLDLEASGRSNFHEDHSEKDWHLGQGRLALSRNWGRHTLSISDELRYYSVPDEDAFDFVRNGLLVTYKRVLSRLWEVQGGYQNIITQYPQSPLLDYTVHGLVVQGRNPWRFNLSTYYHYDLQIYRGAADPTGTDPNTSPDEGLRHTVRLGFDWLSKRHTLSSTYTLQLDRSEMGVEQIGLFEGREESHDFESEFDLIKHKLNLIYSYRFSSKLSLGSYQEWIYKSFDDEELEPEDDKADKTKYSNFELKRDGQKDFLYLSSTFLKYKLSKKFSLKLRYLFRLNRSSLDRLDYNDHIFFLGTEFNFR